MPLPAAHASFPRLRYGSLTTCLIVAISLASAWSLWAAPRFHGLEQGPISPFIQGNVLIRELACARCHTALAESFPPQASPQLSRLAGLRPPAYLRAFLQDSQAIRPQTTVPHRLALSTPSQPSQSIEAVVQFLYSRAEPLTTSVPTENGSPERGTTLFSTIGCQVCHADASSADSTSPMPALSASFTREGLTAFLLNPLHYRPSARMPDCHLSHSEAVDLATYLLGDAKQTTRSTPVDSKLALQGRTLFAKFDCHACHQEQLGPKFKSTAVGVPLEDTDQGCLSDTPGFWPAFDLTLDQRSAIETALNSPSPPSRQQRIEITLRQWNCVVCHERESYGSVTSAKDELFTTADPNLGSQGRLPPSLTGVGAKLEARWLRKTLVQGAPSRPYLRTRMPRFTGPAIDHLIHDLVANDQLPDIAPVQLPERNQAARLGRDLAGTDGLACVTCHTFKNKQAGAMGAIDLTLLGQRVTRNWFHHYLKNPTRFSPSTLMPSFWPGNASPLSEILSGDADQQIEALWTYLREGYGMGSPKGIQREPMRLLANQGEAVMLRRSYRGIGKRGIGVGYPSEINLVYNAEQLCLSLLWPGEFLDPAGVWMSQGHGTARPLFRDPIHLPNTPDLVVLPSPHARWPAATDRPKDYQFLGYRLDDQRRPTFAYRHKQVHVSDSFVDSSNGNQVTLRRTVHFNAPEYLQHLTFRVAAGSDLKQTASGKFTLSDRLRITIHPPAEARLIEAGDIPSLRISLDRSLQNGIQPLELDYQFERPQRP